MQITRRDFQLSLLLGVMGSVASPTWLYGEPDDLAQSLVAQTQRLAKALEEVGEPLSSPELARLRKAWSLRDSSQVLAEIQAVLDPHVLMEAHINPEARVSVTRGAAKAELDQNGWRMFLVKVMNEAGNTSTFRIRSPQAEPDGRVSQNETTGTHDSTLAAVDETEVARRWLELDNWSKPPLQAALSGLAIEYRLLLLYSRDAGDREASLEAQTGEEDEDLGFRSTLPVLFHCRPAQSVTCSIRDCDGKPTMASLLIRDSQGRIYPAQGKRTLPDLWFEKHVYRRDGETIALPPGRYTIEYGRGPEYRKGTLDLVIREGQSAQMDVQLERWIDPRQHGYYSGDTHIHAAGCSHYDSPSEGVPPEVMRRQVQGEALSIGDVLTWGPGYYYQKRFFSGHLDHSMAHGLHEDSSELLRYDIEVSGFPSSHCGHLVLLNLKEQDYPGTKTLDDWPSWNIPILQWARQQGALAGYAHSGHGLTVDSVELPNYLMPPFDSMGANEYVVDVTHEGLVPFISGCDTRPFAELNIWYHTLNCGYRTAFAGETDFPCLSDERVGGGRTYIHLEEPPEGETGYRTWIDGIPARVSYFGDGRSHIFDFKVQSEDGNSAGRELALSSAQKVTITATVCALLGAEQDEASRRIQQASPYAQPYWHLERARLGQSRAVPVELVVNGIAVERQNIMADGAPHPLTFHAAVDKSSWIALRVYPSSHTNPIFAQINGAPIRASKKSAEWCRQAVDVCWKQKSPRIRARELPAAKQAYDHARAAYDRIATECEAS